MNQALTVAEPEWLAKKDLLETVKRTLAAEATPDDFAVFCYQAKKAGLDPLARQIYLVTRNVKVWKNGKESWEKKSTIQASIDGMRLVAERSGEYEGQTSPQWCGEDGHWVDVWLKKESPSASKVGVYRKGFREAVFGVARFDAYAQRDKEGKLGPMWFKMGDVMLAKCAEMLGLRKAFPQELSGIYGKEEMEQAENPSVSTVKTIDAEVLPAHSEDDQRPPEEKAKALPPAEEGEPGYIQGFRNDALVCKSISELTDLWNLFKELPAVKGNPKALELGWAERAKHSKRIKDGQK